MKDTVSEICAINVNKMTEFPPSFNQQFGNLHLLFMKDFNLITKLPEKTFTSKNISLVGVLNFPEITMLPIEMSNPSFKHINIMHNNKVVQNNIDFTVFHDLV